MADPFTIAMAASTALKATSSLVSGMSAASAADAQARLDEGMSHIASAQADAREEQIRRQGRQALGEKIAGIAQSGVGFTQSTRDATDQAAADSSYDALTARYDGTLKRTGLLNDAAAERNKAKVGRITTLMGFGSDALSTAASYDKNNDLFGLLKKKPLDPNNTVDASMSET